MKQGGEVSDSAMTDGSVPLERAVAVVADLPGGRRWGSGFLLTSTLVLTAWHCTVADTDSRAAVPLTVYRHAAHGEMQSSPAGRVAYSYRHLAGAAGSEWGLDVALLQVKDPPWGDPDWTCPPFARVDRTRTGELRDCVAVGYPMYLLDEGLQRQTAQVQGTIRTGEGATSGYLTLQDPSRGQVRLPPHVRKEQTVKGSPWGGLSGAVVFHQGRILGHVVQHRPHLGDAALTVVPIQAIAAAAGRRAREVADKLHLTGPDELPVAADPTLALWRDAVRLGALEDGRPRQVASVTDLSVFGVHRAAALPAGELDYVARDLDGDLDIAFDTALESRKMVLVLGDSAAGKSRAAAAAVQRHPVLRGYQLVVPRPDGGLGRLLKAGFPLGKCLIWLDDLDKHVVGALTPDDLVLVRDQHPDAVVLATMRTSQYQLRSGLSDPVGQYLHDVDRVLEVCLPARLSAPERARLAVATAIRPLLDATEQGVGLGEWLLAGPLLVKKLELAEPMRAALADTVIGWYRTGLQRPLTLDDARNLWSALLPDYQIRLLEQPADTQKSHWEASLGWLCAPIGDLARPTYEQALATETSEGLVPHDYLVDYVLRRPDPRQIPDLLWEHALTTAASPGETWVVGIAAYNAKALTHAMTAMRELADQGSPTALNNVAIILVELDKHEAAVAICEEVVQRFGQNPTPGVREQVVKALVNKGLALRMLDRPEEALAVCEDVDRRFGQDPTPGVREHVARALFNKSVALRMLDRPEEALAIYEEVDRRFGQDPTPGVREHVAGALFNKGVALWMLDRPEEALAFYEEVDRRFGQDPTPGVREHVARALFNKGYVLGRLRRPEEALAVYVQVVQRFGQDPTPGVREQVVKALFNTGVTQSRLDRLGENDDR